MNQTGIKVLRAALQPKLSTAKYLPINVINRQVQGLCLQFILLSHLNQPVHKDAAHGVGDVALLGHVVALRQVFHLAVTQVPVNILKLCILQIKRRLF